MFKNVGSKIKMVARIMCWLGIIGSIVIAIVFWVNDSSYSPTLVPGLIVLVTGSLSSWIGSLLTYGMGELIENVSVLANIAAKNELEKELEK